MKSGKKKVHIYHPDLCVQLILYECPLEALREEAGMRGEVVGGVGGGGWG